MATLGEEDIFRSHITSSVSCLQNTLTLSSEVTKAAELCSTTLRDGGKILACGNGGSALQASHFANELLCRMKDDRTPLAALTLTADPGFLTAASNDYGFEQVFARQVEGLGRAGDMLLCITTSGNSPNLVLALKKARETAMRSVSLLGRDGGRCLGLADVDLLVPNADTAHIQEAHLAIIHTLCHLIEAQLFHPKS